MKTPLNVLLFASSVFLLSGCDDDKEKEEQDAVKISADNAIAVSQSALDFVAYLEQDNNISASSSTVQQHNTLNQKRLNAFAKPLELSTFSTQDSVTGIIEVEDCYLSGTKTLNTTSADSFLIEVDTTITQTYDNCDDGYNEIENGSINHHYFEVTGDPYSSLPYSLKATVTYQNYSITEDGVTSMINGSYVHSEERTDSTHKFTTTSDRLELTSDENTELLENMVQVYELLYDSDKLTDNIDVKLTSSKIGGSITIETQTPFTVDFLYSYDYPVSGSMKITGASNSSILITVLSENELKLEIDSDGDNRYEESNIISWSSLSY